MHLLSSQCISRTLAILIAICTTGSRCAPAPAPATIDIHRYTDPDPRETGLSLQIENTDISQEVLDYKTPSRYESTVLGRRLLALSSTGVLATVFPDNPPSTLPPGLSRTPIGLPDYLASCEEPSGNPTLLALTVSTTTRNALAGSNVSLSLSWWDEYSKRTHREPWSQANLPRLSMIGYLEEMTAREVEVKGIVSCFTGVHRDSRLWLPGDENAAHRGLWMRLVVQEVYWIGGFGDRNFIGWFDVEKDWRRVSVEEWRSARLPGESRS